VSNLRNLEILNLVENEFVTLDSHICQITSLTDLRISHNRLESVSPDVMLLVNLSRCSLDSNLLESLPEEFGAMTSLRHLSLATNDLILNPILYTLYPEFGAMTSLRHLSLATNDLTALPETFAALTLLTLLDVSDNAIAMLPTGIGMCKDLADLLYEGNPLDKMPLELLSNPRAVMDYLGRLFVAGPPPGFVPAAGVWIGKTKCLNLDDLALQAIPPYIYGLGYLEELSARHNQLADLPPSKP
ncbi:hypothetical protein T484DRAFT_1827285, partial [Baffinella frigidus]